MFLAASSSAKLFFFVSLKLDAEPASPLESTGSSKGAIPKALDLTEEDSPPPLGTLRPVTAVKSVGSNVAFLTLMGNGRRRERGCLASPESIAQLI